MSPQTPSSVTSPESPRFTRATGGESGKHLDDHARVWTVYNEETRKYDHAVIERWKSTLDILLVFAGLFSAVITAFAMGSTTAFAPDYSRITASLLVELVNSNRNANNLSPIPPNDLFDSPPYNAPVPRSEVWMYGFWYTSLTISLLVSLACVLVRQWLSSHLSPTSASPGCAAATRQFRHQGLNDWGIPFIIGLLPFILITSLFLFLAGLTIFMINASQTIAIIIGSISMLAFVLYAISVSLPAFYTDCPYRTSLSSAVYRLRAMLSGARAQDFARKEQDEVKAKRYLKKDSLFWLFDHSSSQAVHLAIVEALSGLYKQAKDGGPCSYTTTLRKPLRSGRTFATELMSFIEEWWSNLPTDNDDDFLASLSKGRIKRVAKAAAYLIRFDQQVFETAQSGEPMSPKSWVSETLENPVGFRDFWLEYLLPTFRQWMQKQIERNPDSTLAKDLEPVLKKVENWVHQRTGPYSLRRRSYFSYLDEEDSVEDTSCNGVGYSCASYLARLKSLFLSAPCVRQGQAETEAQSGHTGSHSQPLGLRVNTQFSDAKQPDRQHTLENLPELTKYDGSTPNTTPLRPLTASRPGRAVDTTRDGVHEEVGQQSSSRMDSTHSSYYVSKHPADDEEKNGFGKA